MAETHLQRRSHRRNPLSKEALGHGAIQKRGHNAALKPVVETAHPFTRLELTNHHSIGPGITPQLQTTLGLRVTCEAAGMPLATQLLQVH